MPLGKPTPDGDIVMGSRHYRGGHGSLGTLASWNCPACGKQNDGQKLEHGCLHCGAGDQRQGRAGSATAPRPKTVETSLEGLPGKPGLGHEVGRGRSPMITAPAGPSNQIGPAPLRILRLIEYVIHPGMDVDTTLRNSLVGRMDYAWGTLTATIVDSCDPRQEDLLGLARKQPGVWLANKNALREADHPLRDYAVVSERSSYRTFIPEIAGSNPVHGTTARQEPPPMPDTGPPFTAQQYAIAADLFRFGGATLCYTVALGLQAIAEEAGTDTSRFLSTDDCLALANALMQQVPSDWLEGTAPGAPPQEIPQPDPGQVEEIRQRIREASQPRPVYREVPTDGQA